LSEHTAPARRDLAWGALRRLPALTPDTLYRAPGKTLGEAIALIGQPREETIDRLKALAQAFRRHRDTLDLDDRRDVGLRGAWRRLAVLVHVDPRVRRRALLFALDVPVLTVDEDMSRVVLRLTRALEASGSTRAAHLATGSARARAIARRWLSAELRHDGPSYREAVLYLRHHAQHTCLAAGPHCHVCPLRSTCATGATDDRPGVS
jgi:endonuclease III